MIKGQLLRKIFFKKTNKTQTNPLTGGFFKVGFIVFFWGGFFWAGFFYANPDQETIDFIDQGRGGGVLSTIAPLRSEYAPA